MQAHQFAVFRSRCAMIFSSRLQSVQRLVIHPKLVRRARKDPLSSSSGAWKQNGPLPGMNACPLASIGPPGFPDLD